MSVKDIRLNLRISKRDLKVLKSTAKLTGDVSNGKVTRRALHVYANLVRRSSVRGTSIFIQDPDGRQHGLVIIDD